MLNSARTSTFAGLVLVGLAASPGASAASAPDGWTTLTLPGKAATRFIQADDGSIAIEAENSAAFLFRTIPEDDAMRRYLTWRWRVDDAMAPTDLALKGADDRPLALHVFFPADPDRQSLWDSFAQGLRAKVAGAPFSGKVLTYVWGGIQPDGAMLANPYLKSDGMVVVLRSGRTAQGAWLAEKIDFAADFETAFGYRPPKPAYIALSADADDTASRSIGAFADIRFTDQ